MGYLERSSGISCGAGPGVPAAPGGKASRRLGPGRDPGVPPFLGAGWARGGGGRLGGAHLPGEDLEGLAELPASSQCTTGLARNALNERMSKFLPEPSAGDTAVSVLPSIRAWPVRGAGGRSPHPCGSAPRVESASFSGLFPALRLLSKRCFHCSRLKLSCCPWLRDSTEVVDGPQAT